MTAPAPPTASGLPPYLLPYLGDRAPNVMQRQALPVILDGTRNAVLAAATGAGKTFVAEAALVQTAVRDHRLGVYLCPLRALATEKKEEWERLEHAGLTVLKATGDDDGFDPARVTTADLLVATPERFDALCRHGSLTASAGRIGLIVLDELHMVGDSGRGPVLETLLARLPLWFPHARLVAMSGTLRNARALARWLDADLYESTWRPVALTVRVETYQEVKRRDADEVERTRIAARVAAATLADAGGATLIFCGSRKGVEDCALALARAAATERGVVSAEARAAAARVQHPVLRQVLLGGVGLHHAGLAAADRGVVERLYRGRAIRALVATSTVAMGLNLPARTVVVRDLVLGQSDISASMLLQMAGRAGRVGLEDEGLCVVVAPEARKERVQAMLAGEPITSRLGDDIATPVCGEIALGLAATDADVQGWYRRTLHHVTATAAEAVNLPSVVATLIADGFARREGSRLESTPLGKAASDAMIRVASAHALERALISWEGRQWADAAELEEALLIAVCALPVELAELAARQGDEELCAALGTGDQRLRSVDAGRVRHLIIAATLVSGGSVADLLLDSPGPLAPVVARDLPRYLLFLARRAIERGQGALAVAAAAADLAATLATGLPYRGLGPLYEVVRGITTAGESRVRDATMALNRLLDLGVSDLPSALPLLPPQAARRLSATLPSGPLTLVCADDQVVASLGPHRRALTVRVELRTASGPLVSRTLVVTPRDERFVVCSTCDLVGSSAEATIEARVWAHPQGGPYTLWSAYTGQLTVQSPVGAEADPLPRVLAAETALAGQAAVSSGPDAIEAWQPCEVGLYGGHARDTYSLVLVRARWTSDLGQAFAQAPPEFREVAERLGQGARSTSERVQRVIALLARRRPRAEGYTVRPLRLILGAAVLSHLEAALLGGALLWAMGIPTRLGTADGRGSMGRDGLFCQWQDRSEWQTLLPWPDALPTTSGQGALVSGPPPQRCVDQALLERYTHISPRALALAATAATLSGQLREKRADAQTAAARVDPGEWPPCPKCGGPMKERVSQRGAFLGCQAYPSCRGVRSLE